MLLEVDVAEGYKDTAKQITDWNQGHFATMESPEGILGFQIVDVKLDEVQKVELDNMLT